jgi:hypothetical protein
MNENLAVTNYFYSYLQVIFTYRKISSGFTFPPKKDVLRVLTALKNPSPRSDVNPRTLGLIASTVTVAPSRRQDYN